MVTDKWRAPTRLKFLVGQKVFYHAKFCVVFQERQTLLNIG
jgi:hypothetical protein